MYLKTGGQRLLLTCLAVTVIYKARVKNLICKLLTLIIIEESNLQRFSHSLVFSSQVNSNTKEIIGIFYESLILFYRLCSYTPLFFSIPEGN